MQLIPRFLDQVSRFPQRTAVTDGYHSLTYAELEGTTRALADQLVAAHGLGQRYLVAWPRSISAVIAMLACWRAGGCYVPFDPATPASRAATLLAAIQPTAVFAPPAVHVPGNLPRWDVQPRTGGARAELPSRRDEDEAYLIFTSGSTGIPKGVIVPDRAIARLVIDPDYVSLSSEDVMLHYAAITFDAATFEIWGALLNGATLAIFTEGKASARQFQSFLSKHKVTTAWLTAGLFNALVDSAPTALRGLRQLLTGGEALSVPHVVKALEALPETQLVNGYGPTENTTFTCCYRIPADPGLVATWPSIPVGQAIRGTDVAIVNDDGEPVPAGGIGELVTGGAGLAHGYLADAELTAARFVTLPALGGRRVYRTGDLVRQLPNGAIEYQGRRDQQLKINGFRVEPGELVYALRQLPGVSDAAARGHQTPAGHLRLVGYVVDIDGPTPNEASRLEQLRQTLPEYLLPARLLSLASLPLNANGKVAHDALPNPWEMTSEGPPAPATPLSGPLAAIVAEVLEVDAVPGHLSFTQLGGDSLAAVRVCARVDERLGKLLPLEALLGGGPLHGVDLEACPASPARPEPAPARVSPAAFPLSALQRQVWYLNRQNRASRAYHVTCRLDFTSGIDEAALLAGLERLFRSQPLLHAVLQTNDIGEPIWQLDPGQPVPCKVVDWSDLPAETFSERVSAAITERIREPMNLEGAPLVRWIFWRGGAVGLVCLQLEHHLIHDGWSLRLLLDRWAQAYADEALPESARSPLPVGHPYAEFAQRPEQGGPLPADHPVFAYWRDRLASFPPLRLSSSGSSLDRSEEGRVCRQPLDTALVQRVREQAAAEGVTPFLCYLTAFLATLWESEQTDGGVIGIGVANRTRAEFEETIGMFVNMVPLPVSMASRAAPHASPGQLDWASCRQRVAAALQEALTYQHVPFSEVVRADNPPRTSGANPLFEVLFSMHRRPCLKRAFGGHLQYLEEALDNGAAKFDLNAFVIEAPGDPGETPAAWLRWEWRAERFEARTMEARFRRSIALLEQSVRQPELPVPLPPPGADQPATALPTRPTPMSAVSPDKALFLRVKAVWQRFFPSAALDAESNFFHLGGHSLLSIELIAALEQELLTNISLTTIFEAPTLGALVNHLAAARHQLPFQLSRLNHATETPLVLVHGWGGDPLVFQALTAAVEDRFPLASLHADPRRATDYPDLDSLAKAYAAHLREVLPDQPVLLAGYSLGGIIAWATSLALHAAGAEVRALIVIDTQPPELPAALRLWTRRRLLWQRFQTHLKSLRHVGPGNLSPFLRARFGALQRHAVGHARVRPAESPDTTPAAFQRQGDPYQQLTECWQPSPVPTTLHLIWSPTEGIDLPACWRHWTTGHVASHAIPGPHLALLDEPLCHSVAESLAQTYCHSFPQPRRDPKSAVSSPN